MKESFRQKLSLIIISGIIGLGTGIGGTLVVQNIQKENIKRELHQKLFAEINYNSLHGSLMEHTGQFKNFETLVWEEFYGSPAFYETPVEIRTPLERYYFFIKVYNNYPSTWKQLDKKDKGEMTMKGLTSLTKEYVIFLITEKNIDFRRTCISKRN